jgi:7-cyano-7-deazaguanine synthase in queuosine biosynthesis
MNLEFNENHKKILLDVSGGADSSILLYMLIKYLQETNRTDTEVNVLTMAFDKKGRWTARYATQIIDFVIKNTKTEQIKNHWVFYRKTAESNYIPEMEKHYIKSENISLLMNGRTANPPLGETVINHKGELISLAETSPAPERNVNGNAEVYRYYPSFTVYRPFVNLHKKEIKDLYKKHNLLDTLFPLTRSCEGFDYETNDYQTSCGRCWWCLERKWAFGEY